MRCGFVVGLLALSLSLAWSEPTLANKRVALVIGNSGYTEVARLENPTNDSADIGKILTDLGWDVIERSNVTGREFDEAVETFAARLYNADAALFFYAGHGLMYDNDNYLVPIDAALDSGRGVKRQNILARDIIRTMEERARLSLVFLDACRNNPLAERLRTTVKSDRGSPVGEGLAPMSGFGRETLIMFATAPGRVADDGKGRNSPFTAALLKRVSGPALEIEIMLKRVTADVRRATNGKQEPERLSKLETEFWFKKPTVEAANVDPSAKKATSPNQNFDQQAELLFWNGVKDTRSSEMLQTYLDRFPTGTFAGLARVMIEHMRTEQAARAALVQREQELIRAEQAKKAAEAIQAEEQRKSEDSKRADELAKARDALAAAERERELAVAAAEEARKAADSAKAELEAATKAATEPSSKVASLSPPGTPRAASEGEPRAALSPMTSQDRERALRFMKKGDEQIEEGNVAAARLFYERAADAGLAEAALALAATFEAGELARLKLRDVQPNPKEARRWYERARQLGSRDADQLLRRLGAN
jgi:hypothetical protein